MLQMDGQSRSALPGILDSTFVPPMATALTARPASQLLSGRKFPTANHAPPAALRIRSIGLAQMSGGSGASAASILKSPVGDSRTPARGVTLSVKGGVASQIRVANTDCPAA